MTKKLVFRELLRKGRASPTPSHTKNSEIYSPSILIPRVEPMIFSNALARLASDVNPKPMRAVALVRRVEGPTSLRERPAGRIDL